MFPCSNITDVALDDLVMVHRVDIADKFNFYRPAVLCLQGEVFVPDIPVRFQLTECTLSKGFVFEKSEFPEMFAHKILQRIAKKVKNIGICINNLSGFHIDDQYTVLSGFKQAAVTGFGCLQ